MPIPVFAVALAVAALWAYSTSFAGVFVYDDGPAIVDNAHLKMLWPLTRAMSAPPEATVSGRPIASLSLALNYALAPEDARDVMTPGGGASAPPDAAARFYRNVWGYHAVNLAIHVVAALLLFGVVRRSLLLRSAGLKGPRYDSNPTATGIAFFIALIWVVHPLQTQAVTYVVQRVESLMGMFYLLTLYCAIRAHDDRRTVWIVGTIAACALGMATKEVMVTAPIIVVLWDLAFGVDLRKRLRLYGGLAATWIILIVLVVSEHRPQSVGFDLGWTWWSYMRTQAAVIVYYLRLAVVPVPLVFDYGWTRVQSLADVWPQALLLTAMACATAWAIVKRPPAGFLGVWFFLVLAPTSSVLPIVTEVAAEHRMYLPLAAVIAAIVIGGYVAGERLLSRMNVAAAGARLVGVIAVVAVAAVALTFAELTRARNRVYWSDETLWMDTIQKRPSNPRAYVGYGIDLLATGRYHDAEQQLRTAVSLDDTNGRAHMNLGSALCAQGLLAEGVRHLERALALNPALNEAYGLLGEASAGMGDHARAARYLLQAVALLPDNPFLVNRAASLLATSPDANVRDGAKAIELAERALLVGGQNLLFLDTLAAAYAESNRFAEAGVTARRAIALALTQGQAAFVPELEQHAALFESGRKLRTR